MKICAVICEYNPFHTGHLYHIEKSREKTGADCIIALMSGSFTQRGDAAVFDKWTRAKCAVLSGANLVIELPFCFAAQSAEFFACGAVKLLNRLSCVDYLSFGCETDDIAALRNNAAAINSADIKAALKTGKSYPAALADASKSETLLPNNILAAEYLSALSKQKSDIKPILIKRLGEGYSSEKTCGDFISASGCRRLIFDKNYTLLEKYIPEKNVSVIKECIENGYYSDIENASAFFLGLLRRGKISPDVPYVGEGLENRIYSAALVSQNMQQLYENIKTKRYTLARIKRIILNAATGLTSAELKEFLRCGAGYANVLAADKTGYAAINEIKKRSDIAVISKTADLKALCGTDAAIYEKDFTAAMLYALTLQNEKLRTNRAEFLRGTKPVCGT